MKRFLSLTLSITFLFIIFLSVYSCAKNDNSKIDSTSGSTNQTVTTTKELDCYAAPKTTYYNKYQSDSFINYWKEQQASDDPNTKAWRALDGSAETSLLFPKVIKDGYGFSSSEHGAEDWYFQEGSTDIFGNPKDCSDYFMVYTYNYLWGDHYSTVATMTIQVFKGNPLNDIFLKDELTYEDLKYFVETFKWDEFEEKSFGELEYLDNMIIKRNEYRVESYFIHSGRIVYVGTTDDEIVASPEKLFDYIVFEEITAE